MTAWKVGAFTCPDYVQSLYRERELGLVVQGGGLRGAYSSGALEALLDYCKPSTFDLVIGTSSGALTPPIMWPNKAHPVASSTS
jgi:hypothetical protein